MKTKWIMTIVIGVVIISSCERPITMETKVHEDGTLDKTIVFEKTDSSLSGQNIFGINKEHGWSVAIANTLKEDKDNSKEKFQITFKKHFKNIEAVNAELNTESDTLFKIKTTFEKKFRWFYTYIKYTETFAPINRFRMLPISDYINKEDYQFIERLPSEGTSISKADSLYLQTLNVKIVDVYGNMAMFKEEYDILTKLLKTNNMEQKWFDTLARKQDLIYNVTDKVKGDPLFAVKMMDTMEIPIPREKMVKDALALSKDYNSRIDFMGYAKDGKYKNIVDMPWQLVSTNADSTSGNKLFWHPVVTKFLVTDYVMYAESRKLNVWTLFVSGAFLGLTILALFYQRKRKNYLHVL